MDYRTAYEIPGMISYWRPGAIWIMKIICYSFRFESHLIRYYVESGHLAFLEMHRMHVPKNELPSLQQ